MNILVLGGSNSLMRGSYLDRATAILGQNVPTPVVVRNLSVGGTTTITAIARVFDLPADYAPDLIVYEYALNDTGHLSTLDAGAEVQAFIIRLLVRLLAERFPDAGFAPLLFGVKPLFSPQAKNPIHAAQSRIWGDARIPHLDVRQRLAFIFVNVAPDWLYGDVAHYSTPQGTDIVGSMVGRFLVEQAQARSRDTMRDVGARLRDAHGGLPFTLKAMDAGRLAACATGDWELTSRANRVMSVQALRLRPGARLALPAAPLNLALLSDRRHDLVQLTRRAADGASTWNLVTRFVDVDNAIANPPDMDRFFYSGIPLPLVLRRDAPLELDDTPFEIEVPSVPDKALPTMAFDSFARRLPLVEDRRIDIVSALFLEPES